MLQFLLIQFPKFQVRKIKELSKLNMNLNRIFVRNKIIFKI